MINLNIKNEDNKRYAEYKLIASDQIDNLTLGMLKNNDIEGLAPEKAIQRDEDKFFRFDISNTVTLTEYLGESVKKEKVLKAFYGIAVAIKVGMEYMINWTSYILDNDSIYVNPESDTVQIICVPLIARMNDGNTCQFFKNILFTAQFDEDEDGDYVGKLITMLNPKTFTLEKWIEELENLLEIEHRVFEDNIIIDDDSEETTEVSAEETAEEKAETPVKEPVAETPAEEKEAEESEETEASAEAQEEESETEETAEEKAETPAKEPTAETPAEEKESEETEVSAEEQAEAQEEEPETEETAEEKAETPAKEPAAETLAEEKEAAAEESEETEASAEEQAEAQEEEPETEETAEEKAETPAEESASEVPAEEAEKATEELVAEESAVPVHESHVEQKKGGLRKFLTQPIKFGSKKETPRPYLQTKAGAVFHIEKEKFSIGSSTGADYVIQHDDTVKPIHAYILKEGEEYFLMDNESVTGTFMNGVQLMTKEKYPLPKVVHIRIGNEEFDFNLYD